MRLSALAYRVAYVPIDQHDSLEAFGNPKASLLKSEPEYIYKPPELGE